MATYCNNHVLDEIRKLAPNSKGGAVLVIPTKEGQCGKLGGCVTAHDDLFELKSKYRPTDDEKEDAREAKAEADAQKEEADKAAKEKAEKDAAAESPTEPDPADTEPPSETETPTTEPIPAV